METKISLHKERKKKSEVTKVAFLQVPEVYKTTPDKVIIPLL